MNKKLLLIAAAIAGISGLCVLLIRSANARTAEGDEHASEAQWANEGGANSPPSV
jgi:hypothetical protein